MSHKFTVSKKDLEITWFSGKGGGGQHRNKHQNCCRIKHVDTGVIATGQSHRERKQNQKEAIYNLANNAFFKAFCTTKLRELEDGKTIEEWVAEQMKPENILTQGRDENGKWVKI